MSDTNDPAIHCAHVSIVPITDIKPNPRNPNRHPDNQLALLTPTLEV